MGVLEGLVCVSWHRYRQDSARRSCELENQLQAGGLSGTAGRLLYSLGNPSLRCSLHPLREAKEAAVVKTSDLMHNLFTLASFCS